MSNGRVEVYCEDKIYYGANSSVKMNPPRPLAYVNARRALGKIKNLYSRFFYITELDYR